MAKSVTTICVKKQNIKKAIPLQIALPIFLVRVFQFLNLSLSEYPIFL
jgi:hypothetical protein